MSKENLLYRAILLGYALGLATHEPVMLMVGF